MKLRYAFYTLLLLLPGCRYIGWAENVFYQSKIQYSYRPLQDDYIRTLRVYDQLTTLGFFDVLWLSDAVRGLYSREYAALYRSGEVCYDEVLQTELEKNQEGLSFIILAAMPRPYDPLLTDPDTPWTIYLCADGVSYAPVSLETIELDHIYQTFFGARFTPARTAYYVTYSGQSAGGQSIITGSTSSISLCFHYTGRADECVVWKLASPGAAVACCVDNPDILAYDIRNAR